MVRIGVRFTSPAGYYLTLFTNPLVIAVNVSAVQLHNPLFVQFVHGTLHQFGPSAERLARQAKTECRWCI